MGISSAVQWWQEWQMRVLVLSSLFVYLSLFYADTVRKYPALRKLRFLVWLAFVGGDALAIYGLATLFNRQRQRTACGSHGSSDLEVLWAPVLLIHLGGQPTMSAYSLEDNELWKRHAMTLVSQVSVALYVFCNWWSGERQLLNAAVLLFVVGIIKFSYKPWALKRASFKSMLASSALEIQRQRLREGNVGWLWRVCTTYVVDANPNLLQQMTSIGRKKNAKSTGEELEVEETREEESDWRRIGVEKGEVTDCTLGAFVRSSRRCYMDAEKRAHQQVEGYMFAPVSFLYKMFVDVSTPYSIRLEELNLFLKFSDKASHTLLKQCLYNTFVIIYTRARVTLTILGAFLQLSLPFLTFTSVVLFAKSDKTGYDVKDIWVTYILFGFTALHEFLPFLARRFFIVTWHENVSQGSLMLFCARQESPNWCMKIGAIIADQSERINKYFHVEQVAEAQRITERVRQHVKDGWKTYIHGPVSYRRFNNLRGQWALERLVTNNNNDWRVLTSSCIMAFDESVLIWHVATDLCYYTKGQRDGGSDANRSTQQEDPSHLARLISNYMAYLLFIRPEMLVPGARSGLFNVFADDFTGIVKSKDKNKGIPDVKREIAQQIADVISSPEEFEVTYSVLVAKDLFEALMRLGDDKRWKLIEGVWVEMLCFSAARCSGYLHAQSMGHGGEFLSYVWLLWSAMGMETLADKIIKTEPSGEEQRKAEELEEEEGKREAQQETESVPPDVVSHTTVEIPMQ